MLLLAGTCLAHLPALSGGFIWDDDAHLPQPALRSLDGLRRIWLEPGTTIQYYPLLYSAFWIEHRAFGDAPAGYHGVNLALHLAAVSVLYTILRKLRIPGAWLAAAIFALHPVQVETVAWISEQKNTLSTLFYLLAMLAYLKFDHARDAGGHRRWYLAAFGCFILSLLSKTVTATLPGGILVLTWWKRGRLEWRRDALPLLPFFAFGAAGGLLSAYAERNWVGAAGPEYGPSLLERVLLAGRVAWFYAGKLFWPANLTFSYPKWNMDVSGVMDWMYLLSALLTVVALWLLRHRARAPLAGILFFGGTLFPVLGFFNLYPFAYSYVADHFQYLASLGILVPAAAGAALFFERLHSGWNGRPER